MTNLVVRKIAKCGVRVSSSDRTKIRSWLSGGSKGQLIIEDGDDCTKDVQINFSVRDSRRISGKIKNLRLADAEKATFAASEVAAEYTLKAVKKSWPKAAKHQLREDRKFKKHISELWGEPIELLAMILTICRELGDRVMEELAAKPKIKTPCLFHVMQRLHARSCQIADEIITLLRAGFPDGAMARWRSLHEVTVVLHFIWLHGESVASRYLNHNVIESYRAALKHDATCGRFDRAPLPEVDLAQLREMREVAIKKYGKEFAEDYGWAAKALKKTRPKFSDIQESVEQDHWRADYQIASYNVHAGSKGVTFRLSTPYTDDVVSGASDFGLCEPGQNTAISLNQVAAIVIQIAPSIERVASAKAVDILCEETLESFSRSHDMVTAFIEEDELKPS